MKNLSLFVVLLLVLLITEHASSLENFWYKDIAVNETGQLLPDTTLNIRVTIERNGGVLFQEEFTGLKTNQLGNVIFKVGTGTTLSGDLSAINTFADTRIKVETSTGISWVLSSYVTLAQVYRYQELEDLDGLAWMLAGNEGTNPDNDFLGTSDDVDLVFRINNEKAGRINRNKQNTAFGYQSLYSESNGYYNTAFGYQSLFSDTTGWSNVAIGNRALYSNKFRGNIVAIGDSALFNNGNNFSAVLPDIPDSIKAIRNTAVGSKALLHNDNGFWNTAVGYQAIYYNTYGKSLTAVGVEALMNNTIGKNNTAVGTWALYNNQDGSWNTGLGSGALKSNVSGDTNTVVGLSAMYYNNGDGNVAMGMFAAAFNSTGNGNTALGTKSLFHNGTGNYNVAVGYQAAQSYWYRNYNNSVFLGAFADANYDGADNVIAIGYNTKITANNQVRLGNSNIETLFCSGAYNGTSAAQPNMVVNAQGQIMRSTTSDRIFNNLTVNGNTVLGNNTANSLTVNALINSDILPDGTVNLGSTINRWNKLYLSGNSIHIGNNGDEAEISYTADSHLKFTKPVLTPNSIVSLTANASYSGTAETGLVLYVYNTSGTDYTFEGINVPNGQMKVFVYTGATWVATN